MCRRAAFMKNPTRTMTDTTLATAHVGVSTNDFPSSASIFIKLEEKTMQQSSKSFPFHVQELDPFVRFQAFASGFCKLISKNA